MSSRQQVGVFFDVANIVYSLADSIESDKWRTFDYARLLDDSVGARELSRAFAYTMKSPVEKHKMLQKILKAAGFAIHLIDPYKTKDGIVKCNADTTMVLDAYIATKILRLDTVVLITGDGDFLPLVERLQSECFCRVEVVAFKDSTHWKLRQKADSFYDLQAHLGKYMRAPAPKEHPIHLTAARRQPEFFARHRKSSG